jgi:hypothetical protein
VGTIQQSIGTQPVISRIPPPEGTSAAGYTVTLTPDLPNFSTALQLNSQAGLMMSQVVTMVIDNSDNNYAIQVVHGVFNEVTNVPANGGIIVPTFSNSGSFPLNVSTMNGITPIIDLQINIIFCNYSRPSGSFGNTQASTIAGTGQNTVPLYPTLVNITSAMSYEIAPIGNYILDSLDLALEAILPTADALTTVQWQLITAPLGEIICQGQISANLNGPNIWFGGNAIYSPIDRTWPLGLILPRQNQININIPTLVNVSQCLFRVNLSGINTP